MPDVEAPYEPIDSRLVATCAIYSGVWHTVSRCKHVYRSQSRQNLACHLLDEVVCVYELDEFKSNGLQVVDSDVTTKINVAVVTW